MSERSRCLPQREHNPFGWQNLSSSFTMTTLMYVSSCTGALQENRNLFSVPFPNCVQGVQLDSFLISLHGNVLQASYSVLEPIQSSPPGFCGGGLSHRRDLNL